MMTVNANEIQMQLTLNDVGEVVLLDPANDAYSGRNVFLLTLSGEVTWQIEACTRSHGVNHYSAIELKCNDELVAYSPNGIEYSIDKADGSILKRELIR